LISRLVFHYYEINEGLGIHKSPSLYGAFPTDPYSHTPSGKGAQQPGMTGQVKEDILCRLGELGIVVNEGRLGFNPRLLRKKEFLTKSQDFAYIDIDAQTRKIRVDSGSLCFTYCQIPIIYKLAGKAQVEVVLNDKTRLISEELRLDNAMSTQVFQRSGKVVMIIVSINETILQ
jgi:hypothetical protein